MALQYGRSRLIEHLARKKLSQAEFARRLGKSEAYVTQIINGSTKFSLLTAKRAATILDCIIDDLYYWEID